MSTNNTPLGSFEPCDNRKFSGNLKSIRSTQKKYHEQLDFGQLHSVGHTLGAGNGDLNRVNQFYEVLSADMQSRFRAWLATEKTLSQFFRVNIDADNNVSFGMKKGWQKRLADTDPDVLWLAINTTFRNFGSIKEDPATKYTDFETILKMVERAASTAANGTEKRPLEEHDAKFLQITVSNRIEEFCDELRNLRAKQNGVGNTGAVSSKKDEDKTVLEVVNG